MLKRLLILAMTVIIASAATLVWDPNPVEEGVTNYRIYWAMNGVQQPTIDTGTETQRQFTITRGVAYSWYVTAVNYAHLESLPSETVTYQLPVEPQIPEILVTSIAYGGYQAGVWSDVVVNWAPIDVVKYGITDYVLTFSSLSTGQKLEFRTPLNSFTVTALPRDEYAVYVTATNSSGTSPTETYAHITGKAPGNPTGPRVITPPPPPYPSR